MRQNAHLTYKGNVGFRRHGWLRLTPAYSYRLVSDSLKNADQGALVLDPFSGTGTTGLVAAENGMAAFLLDINPFLVWFGRAKTRNYNFEQIAAAKEHGSQAVRMAEEMGASNATPRVPPLHRIDRWWSPTTLYTLALLKESLDSMASESVEDDLLKIAFCRAMIAESKAAFNHQSMSFKEAPGRPLVALHNGPSLTDEVFSRFNRELQTVTEGATDLLSGFVTVHLDDARKMDSVQDNTVDFLVTSPPYANRMSYIREVRPYMYWLRYLVNSKEAGEIDWQSIGGTWGSATSRLTDWKTSDDIPLGSEFSEVLASIAHKKNSSGGILSRYVYKYFVDIYCHLKSAHRVVRSGGRVTYVVGNSTFYGINVPTEHWYARLLSELGFYEVKIETIRKRNSNKKLFEFAVSALKT